MRLSHYYQALLLLGSLLVARLHATNYDRNVEPYVQRGSNYESFYEHGDLTFFDREKDKINQKELHQGLIELSQQIKAKEGRKVYFFVGATGAGKSFTIMALQGNKIAKVEEDNFSDSDEEIYKIVNDETYIVPESKFEIKYVLPKNQVPVVGNSATGQTATTLIYYPDPKKEQYKDIAFADTEGFFGRRKATPAGKCLSAVAFPYALKVNKVGGLVLVLSASGLDASRGGGVGDIVYVLQEYFAKSVSNKTMKPSILLMITKVSEKNAAYTPLLQLRAIIQLFYKQYYASESFFSVKTIEFLKGVKKNNNSNISKKDQEKIEQQDKYRYLKYFSEMLLKKDVPKDDIGDIMKFQMDKRNICFMQPWEADSVKKNLTKSLSSTPLMLLLSLPLITLYRNTWKRE